MAAGEDRPIVVTGGSAMATVTLPPATEGGGRSITVKTLEPEKPFQTIELSNSETGEVITKPANGNWTVTIK